MLSGVAGARLSGVCSRVKLCSFGLMSLSGMHLIRSDVLQAEAKYTPYCITTEKLQTAWNTKLLVSLLAVKDYC